jgi:hypothetical protein
VIFKPKSYQMMNSHVSVELKSSVFGNLYLNLHYHGHWPWNILIHLFSVKASNLRKVYFVLR